MRIIRRYGGGSRKLYDTQDSRYIALDEIAGWVRGGQRIRVVDSKSGADVTAQVLAQVIVEEEKRGVSVLSSDLMHDVLRRGERALQAGVEQVQQRVDRVVQASLGSIRPVRRAREELATLRRRLDQLERSLQEIERPARATGAGGGRAGRRPGGRQQRTRKASGQ